jgi:hypothetical protein
MRDEYQAIVPRTSTGGDEAIDQPAHYQHPSGMECIQVAKLFGFCLGNVVKYIWRFEFGNRPKEKKLEDLKKARKYIDIKIADFETEK